MNPNWNLPATVEAIAFGPDPAIYRERPEAMGLVFPTVAPDGQVELVQTVRRRMPVAACARGRRELAVVAAVGRGDHERARPATPTPAVPAWALAFGPPPLLALYHEYLDGFRAREKEFCNDILGPVPVEHVGRSISRTAGGGRRCVRCQAFPGPAGCFCGRRVKA